MSVLVSQSQGPRHTRHGAIKDPGILPMIPRSAPGATGTGTGTGTGAGTGTQETRRKSRSRKQKDKQKDKNRTRRRQRSKSTPAVHLGGDEGLETDPSQDRHHFALSSSSSSSSCKRLPFPSGKLPALALSGLGSRSLSKLAVVQQQQWQRELQQQGQQWTRRRTSRSLSPEKTSLSSINNSNNNENANPRASPAKSKPKKPSLLSSVKPDNVEEEKEKFIKSKFTYNPQFVYKNLASEETLENFSPTSARLMPMAKQILRTALDRHGSFEKFMENTGGRKLNRMEIMDVTRKYLREEGLDKEISVQLSDTMVPRACMTRVRGQPTLQVKVGDIREFWVDGMLRHELGTHYIRSCNNRLQVWQSSKKRRQLGLLPLNPTEEGLASLHSVIFREQPCMWRSACLYYTVYQAARMSFVEVFRDLGKYIRDAETRWDYCVRAKRGMVDTSRIGAFNKDQVYLKGALDILKHRHEIDFNLLMRSGKVCFHDLDKLKDLVVLENTRLPRHMLDMRRYREALDDILFKNGLTDEDLDILAY